MTGRGVVQNPGIKGKNSIKRKTPIRSLCNRNFRYKKCSTVTISPTQNPQTKSHMETLWDVGEGKASASSYDSAMEFFSHPDLKQSREKIYLPTNPKNLPPRKSFLSLYLSPLKDVCEIFQTKPNMVSPSLLFPHTLPEKNSSFRYQYHTHKTKTKI